LVAVVGITAVLLLFSLIAAIPRAIILGAALLGRSIVRAVRRRAVS
jgi:hypothetical protein